MADNLSREKRSYAMSRVRSTDTGPEVRVRSLLHRLGYRFRKNVKHLPGRPDIVLQKHSTVVFVNGCFWHQHRGCKRSRRPESNSNYWNQKLDQNQIRDERVKKSLKALGWKVVVVWTCEVRDAERLTRKLVGQISR